MIDDSHAPRVSLNTRPITDRPININLAMLLRPLSAATCKGSNAAIAPPITFGLIWGTPRTLSEASTFNTGKKIDNLLVLRDQSFVNTNHTAMIDGSAIKMIFSTDRLPGASARLAKSKYATMPNTISTKRIQAEVVLYAMAAPITADITNGTSCQSKTIRRKAFIITLHDQAADSVVRNNGLSMGFLVEGSNSRLVTRLPI